MNEDETWAGVNTRGQDDNAVTKTSGEGGSLSSVVLNGAMGKGE